MKNLTIWYTNWKGVCSERTIIPKELWYGTTEWHPKEGWLLNAYDVDKKACRDFALKDFGKADPDKFFEAVGWTHAQCCAWLDEGKDPRTEDIGQILPMILKDFGE